MEQTVAVKEMFDGLYNIIVGPGFYTVSGAKKKKPKVSKSGLQSMVSHEDMMSSVSDQDSSREEKEYAPSTENVGDVSYKSSAGSDSDGICYDNVINGPNTVFVSYGPLNDIPRTESHVSSEHKQNNICDSDVRLRGKQTTDDKSVGASLKSKSCVTKDPGCASRFGYSKQPTDLTRSSRGSGSKGSSLSVVRVDRNDVISKQSRSLQGEGTSNVPHVSHKTNKSELTSKQCQLLQGEGPTDVSHVSHKANKSELTSKQSSSPQGEGPSSVSQVLHKGKKSDVTSEQSRSAQGEGLSTVPSVSRISQKTNLEGADLTISSRRSSGRPPLSPEKTMKCRIKPSLAGWTVKLYQEETTSASFLERDNGRAVIIPDLTISSRRSSGRPKSQLSPEKSVRRRRQSFDGEASPSVDAVKLQEEQKTAAASILKSGDERPVTILETAPGSSKDVDAGSDISTDSHASGYTQSRPAVPSSGIGPGGGHRKLRKKTAPGHLHSRLSCSPVKKSAEKSETKISPVKRKHDGDSRETLCSKKVKSDQGGREKTSQSKIITDKHKNQTPTRKKVRTKVRRNDKDNKLPKHNSAASVSYRRLQSLRGLINIKKSKQCSNQSPAKCSNRSSRGHTVRRLLRSSTKDKSAKNISPAAHKSSPRKKSLRGMPKAQYSQHKQSRHHSSTKQKAHTRNNRKSDSKHRHKHSLTVKQGSDIDKHRIKSKRRRRRMSADSLQEALAQQQRVIDEHSKEKDKFEDGNIISALCQLEDRAKTLHSHDLDILMPMSDLPTNRNAVLGVRGQGQNNHPGGVWKKLIPEN